MTISHINSLSELNKILGKQGKLTVCFALLLFMVKSMKHIRQVIDFYATYASNPPVTAFATLLLPTAFILHHPDGVCPVR